MPKLFSFRGYTFFFWTAENGETVHVHVSKGRPTPNATKIWLTRSGGCVLASNGSRIRQGELREILEFVALNHGRICDQWKNVFQGDLEFYQ